MVLNLFNNVSVLMPSVFALMQNAALELEGGELSFEAGPDGRPKKVEGKTPLPMMAVVAEMMIFANAAVAHRIAGAFPGAALLRRHAPPRRNSSPSDSSSLSSARGTNKLCKQSQSCAHPHKFRQTNTCKCN